MKTKLLYFKNHSYRAYCFVLLCCSFNLGWSQQVIGEFPTMDGGLEGQTATTTLSSIGSTGTPSETNWSVSSTSNSEVRTISDLPENARTGNFSAVLALKSTANNSRLQAPTPATPAFQVDTEYTIQYFYKTDTDPETYLAAGIYLNSTSGGVASTVINPTPFAVNTWTKGYSTITSGSTAAALNWAVARISTSPNADVYNATVNFDDFVVYSGGYDETVPSAATSGSYTVNEGTTTVSWLAPSNATDLVDGLIGGGYVVFRYDSMPNADNDPNQNGIYKIGNTTTNGTDSFLGTVVYIGTNTNFDEPYVAGAYYKIYAVDKAFNYSEEIMVFDPALSIVQNEVSNVALYPNPVKNTLFINGQQSTINSVSIYSTDGKNVFNQKYLTNNSVDISNLSNGVYFVKISSDNSTITKRIIKE